MANNRSGSAENIEKGESNREKVAFLTNTSEKSEINELKSDVDALSNEVQTAVVDLKKSIGDIRSSVSEMENPFNLLSTVSSEKDVEEHNEERLPSGVKSLILGKPEEIANNDKELSLPKLEPISPQIEVATKEKPNRIVQSSLPLKPLKASAYLDWIWDLLDAGLTADDIRQLACSSELMSYLPAQASELIYSLAVTAEKIRLIGFTKGHLLLFFYKAAAISKISIDPEDMEALISITEHQLEKPKNNRTEHQVEKPKNNKGAH
ncbi:MAG TPA: hypothetical protein VJY36_00110 [Candidatus Bathyarchaeia archaeon]|nr:hypothetical protein [Candidatus Bathyarchaeia archaeon]